MALAVCTAAARFYIQTRMPLVVRRCGTFLSDKLGHLYQSVPDPYQMIPTDPDTTKTIENKKYYNLISMIFIEK